MGTQENGAAAVTNKEIADRISNALITKNVPASFLAERTDMSYKQVRATLKGDRSLTVVEFRQIAEAINVKPSTLLPDTFASQDAA